LGDHRGEDPRPRLVPHPARRHRPRRRGRPAPAARAEPSHAGLRSRSAQGGGGEVFPGAGDRGRRPARGVIAPRFGFFFWRYEPALVARMVRLGEEQGWDLVGIADTPGNAMDVWVALAQAATLSTRVRLASCVTNLATRDPAITAGAAASIDKLSGGRFVLGVGAGHSGVVNVGRRPTPPADLREGLTRVRGLLGDERPVPVYAAA